MKYEVTAMPVLSVACHCTHCMKVTGIAYSINLCAPSKSFKIHGDTLDTYVDQGDSGENLRRYFCSNCGSLMFTEDDVTMPMITIVKVGTLDDTSKFKPTTNIFCESKMDSLNQDS